MKKICFIILYLTCLYSQNTSIPQSILSSGAVHSESDETKLIGTLGQTFIQKIQSANSILASGFWGSIAQFSLSVDDVIPEEFSISNAYPNPFNPTVSIDFLIPEKTDVNIQVFDLLGRNVFTHQQEFANPGKYRFQWNARDNSGKNVANGIYIVAIQHQEIIYKQKITFLK